MDDLKLCCKSKKKLDSLIQTAKIFSTDIQMSFGIDKCAVLIMKMGKVLKSDGISLPDGRAIKSLSKGRCYKYLSVLQANEVKRMEMNEKVTKEYN